MSFEARVLLVLIASPGDTADARDAVERTITSWNRDRARSERVVLTPLRWEADAVPELGGDGQEVINRQLVEECDIVVALFHSRLGVPTARSASGTAEEIDRARDRGVPVHVYFSEMPIPRSVEPSELERLNQFRSGLQGAGLLGSYASLDDLSAKVRTALERDVRDLISASPGRESESGPTPRAILRARYEYDREPETDSRGRVRMRTRRERLVIENVGTESAENIEVDVEAIGEGDPPMLHLEGPIERILPKSSVNVMAMVHMGVAAQWRVTIRWQEGGSPFEESQAVTPF
jgi:hypothetical protein